MKIASINCNKRLGSAVVAGRVAGWLARLCVDLICAQEPRTARNDSVVIPGWRFLGGNEKVASWARRDVRGAAARQLEDYWQSINLGHVRVENIYLDAYSQARRADQLRFILRTLRHEHAESVMIVGDFNIAPAPHDGLSGDRPSDFNSDVDRAALNELLTGLGLKDMTDAALIGRQEYSIVRVRAGSIIKFRCDLALISDLIANDTSVTYDHTSRLGDSPFSDHAAVIVDTPGEMDAIQDLSDSLQGELFEPTAEPSTPLHHAYKTAIRRSHASAVARALVDGGILNKLNVRRILDYGCGVGTDVAYYRGLGIDADGFDPYPGYGWMKGPIGRFDLVCVNFVLNVIPDPEERLEIVRLALNFVERGGALLVVCRSPEAIRKAAEKGRWKPFRDGFWSHEGKRTFQKGISKQEIVAIVRRAGATIHAFDADLNLDMSQATSLLARRD